MFKWLKHYVPRGIYGRAALILILPVVTLQLVVSVVFIQRHFDGVTTQMTHSMAGEVRLILQLVNDAQTITEAQATVAPLAEGLAFQLGFDDVGEITGFRRWYDFSGSVVVRELYVVLPETLSVQLPNDRIVRLFVRTDFGPAVLEFNRLRVSASNPHQLLVNMAFFGILMTLISFIYLRNQLRPITRLAVAAEAFGRGQHVPYSPAGALEVRAAGNAFLSMRSRIERQIEQRTMLLSGVSHDLRTPLTRLRLGLSFLTDEEREPLERDVDDMQHMLDEFLNFARGASETTPEPVNLKEMLADIVRAVSRGAEGSHLERCEVEKDVMLRKMVVQRAVENLVNNALRYGKTVQVSAYQRKKSIIIRVEDDGPGIPADQREDALKPFARLDEARNQDKGSGVGLGLAIAADAARAHGGMLRLGDSRTLGGLQADLVLAI